jgi:hypothetical protein
MSRVQQIHQRIPALREMLYAKDKARYVPSNMRMALRKDFLIQQLTKINKRKTPEYNKFENDIYKYDWRKPIDPEVMDEIDFEEIKDSFSTSPTFIYFDLLIIGRSQYNVYCVTKVKRKYVCIYRFGRYTDPQTHPGTPLLYCIPIQ